MIGRQRGLGAARRRRRGAGAGRSRTIVALGLAVLAVGALVAIPALGATPKTGDWSGKARESNGDHNGDLQFSTIRNGKHVRGFVLQQFGFGCFDAAGHPSGGGGGMTTTTALKPKVKKGKFHFTETTVSGDDLDTVKARGHFTSKTRAEGTVSWKEPQDEGRVCKTGKLHWNAKLTG
jgi:hypothetical protein